MVRPVPSPDPQVSPTLLQRPIRFLVPGTGGRFRCGGLLVELQTARLVGQIAPVQVVTYRRRETDHPFLDDLLQQEPLRQGRSHGERPQGDQRQGDHLAAHADFGQPDQPLWIVSWGFDVPALLRRLRGRPVAYHAHSSGYGFDLPAGVPVLAVSRNTLGYWGDRAPRHPLFLVPNALEPAWIERGARHERQQPNRRRPIDVLVQQRKSSPYVLQQLVPALRQRGLRVEVQSGWVDDLVTLFNDATVYLYDSADHWRTIGVSEGFGLPPIEALACGCVVFSSCNHALADSLDPGLLGHQIGWGSLKADVERITSAAAEPNAWHADPTALELLLHSCSEPVLLKRWQRALTALETHWQLAAAGDPWLRSPSRISLRWRHALARLRRQLTRR